MGKKQFAKEPLLYIHQPTISTPKAPMQHDYYTPRKSKESIIKDIQPPKNVRTRPLNRMHQVKDENIVEEEAEQEKNELADEQNNDKQFNELTLQQKVDYFIERPKHAPIIRCEIKTEERAYRGVITDSKDNIVSIRVGRRTSSTEIPFGEIQSIRILGF